jgi:putative FmdB family regulatory protein
MPLYEYVCECCGRKEEVFARNVHAAVSSPACPNARDSGHDHNMKRIMSPFARHLTEGDKLAEAEATYGAEVEAVMGTGPDIGRLARRYDRLSEGLAPE